ncbi:3 beta-hydroxysteroid dehydrogenase type 7-like [Lampetra fluviatilis]
MEVVGPNIHGDPFYRGNEETRYRTLHAVAYPASKAEAERLVITASGTALGGGGLLRTVSLRPLGIYGEGHNVLESYYRRAGGRDGWLLRGVPEDVEHGRVYVGNVAWMHALALRALSQGREGVEGEVFYCYDDSPRLSYEDFNMEILSLCGVRMLRWLHAPAFFLRLMGMINDALRSALALFGVSYIPLLTRYTVAMALTVFSVDTDKAARAFGYAPRYSWAQARDRTAAWIRSLDGGGDEADRKGK